MDYKNKLNEMAAKVKSENEAKQLEQKAYYEDLAKTFAPLATSLKEISEAVDPSIATFRIDPYSVTIQIGTTRYEARPNSSFSPYKPNKLEPGFRIDTKTTFKYADVDCLERNYVLKSEEAVVDEVMKLLAKAMASSSKK